jgi:hypothetical protein
VLLLLHVDDLLLLFVAVESDNEEDEDDVVETDAPDEAETEVKILLDFFSETPLCDETDE